MMLGAMESAVQIFGGINDTENQKLKLMEMQVEFDHREQMFDSVLTHEREIFVAKANLMRDIIQSMIDRRVDAVCKGFHDTLTLYADQCRHYMGQQDRYADMAIKSASPLERANIKAQQSEINIQLSDIRSEAAALYRHMTKIVLLIGGSMPPLAAEQQQTLALAKA